MSKKQTADEGTTATISVNGGPPVPMDQIEKFLDGAGSGSGGPLGPGLWMPTRYKPHLVVRKKAAKDSLCDEHGVSIRRLGDDCLVEASNGVSSVSILLADEGANAPAARVVIPARAAKLIADAAPDIETARLWFLGARVVIAIGDEIHQFSVQQPDLPFPGENLRDKAMGSRSLAGVSCDADHMLRLQKALAADFLELRWISRGVVSVIPDGAESAYTCGFLALVGTLEQEASRGRRGKGKDKTGEESETVGE